MFPRKFCYVLAKKIALFKFYFSKCDREAVRYNLAPIVKDKKKLKQYTKEVFINFAYYLVDFFRYAKLDKEFVKKYVRFTGLDNLDRALSNGGAIALTAHLGNYEFGGVVVSLLGYKFSAVALPHKDPRLTAFFTGHRNRFGIEVISTGLSIKRCFSALKKGKLLGLVADRDFGNDGMKAKMFSQYAILPKGAAFFHLHTGASIVPAFFVREDKYFYRLIFESPIQAVDYQGLTDEDIVRLCIPVLEKYISKYPQQWYMFQPYWIKEEVVSSK